MGGERFQPIQRSDSPWTTTKDWNRSGAAFRGEEATLAEAVALGEGASPAEASLRAVAATIKASR
jgi:hypothetical protein